MKPIRLLTLLLVLSGCDTSSNNTKTPEQIQAEVAESQRQFKENQQRIEAENKALKQQLVEQRSYVTAHFLSVNEDFLEVKLVNETTKDIDNIVGALEVFDSNGNSITSIALTNWVPGDIYLPNASSTLARKNLKLETPEKRNQILNHASDYQYAYTVLRIQFAGEDEIKYIETAEPVKPDLPTKKTITQKKEPINQVAPLDCASNQISLETENIYYPGPKCEHIGRNIDSERFKLEYIDMCKAELGITEHLPSVAKVQVSSCIYETDRPGLTYKKRICCDLPN